MPHQQEYCAQVEPQKDYYFLWLNCVKLELLPVMPWILGLHQHSTTIQKNSPCDGVEMYVRSEYLYHSEHRSVYRRLMPEHFQGASP